MIAIVDCNNFYASCEMLFNPKLYGRPVVVLSNNDGCVIARSEEAKQAGVKMGAPIHLIDDIIKQHRVEVFSSNYALYGDISARVMAVLREYSPAVEEYSVDEAFIDLSEMPYHDIRDFCKLLRERIWQGVGIRVSIGAANTKTLSKVANRYAKKRLRDIGVCVLDNPVDIQIALDATPVEDIWGVGRQYSKMLNRHNINTGLDFALANPQWVKKQMAIVGLRTLKELNGMPCISLELQAPDKQTIMNTRSFGKSLTDPEPIREAISNFTARAAEKLRAQESCASYINVFIETNRFKKEERQLYDSARISLPNPTNFTPYLIEGALFGFEKIWRTGYKIKRAGIMIGDFVPERNLQRDMFEPIDPVQDARMRRVMKAVDSYNRLNGRDTIRLGMQGYNKDWKMRQLRKSPNRTTSWHELLVVDMDKIPVNNN